MSDDIFAAISADDKVQVAKLIAANPDVAHARNQAGVSALMQARYENKLEIVALLREARRRSRRIRSSGLGRRRPPARLAGK